MGRIPAKAACLLLAASIVLGTASPSVAALTDSQRAARGVGFLRTQQKPNGSIPAFSPVGSTADAVMAIVSAGVGPRVMADAIGFLRRKTELGAVNNLGLRAKVVLALVTAGGHPRHFAGHNLVREIRSTADVDGRLDGGSVFDQALGVLALRAAGASLPANSTQWLLDGQCPDGGWAFDAPFDPMTDDAHCSFDPATDFFPSDTNTTGYVVMALESSGDAGWTDDPFAFFDDAREASQGWGYQPGFSTDANSTALVLQAYSAASLSPPLGSRGALRRLHMGRCGAWNFSEAFPGPNVGATIGAIPGLLGDPFPFAGTVLAAAPRTPACA